MQHEAQRSSWKMNNNKSNNNEPIAQVVNLDNVNVSNEARVIAVVDSTQLYNSPLSAESNEFGICRRCRREFRRTPGLVLFSYLFWSD